MEEVQEGLDQVNAANEADSGEGYNSEDAPNALNEEASESMAKEDDPLSVKKRLGQQAKKHQREMRQMQEQIMRMQQHMEQSGRPVVDSNANPIHSPGQPNGPSGSEEERIARAVRLALGAQEAEQRKAKEAEGYQHVQKKYMALNDEFDRASDKYDDFDEVVRGHDVPFSPAIRDALLFIDNPADVAYKLGKNRQELQRISQLHPLDQAREVNKLSFALMGGQTGAKPAINAKAPMGQIRTNPTNSSGAVTDKTPPSVIRARMKAGTWK